MATEHHKRIRFRFRFRKPCGQDTTVSFDVPGMLQFVRHWRFTPRAFAKVVRAVYMDFAEQCLLTRHQSSAQLWPYTIAKVGGTA